MKKIFLFVAIGLCWLYSGGYSATAQDRKQMESKRLKIEREIAAKNKLLKETRKDAKEALTLVTTLHNQIQNRQELLSDLRDEIAHTDEVIGRDTLVIAALQEDIVRLSREFTRNQRRAFRMQQQNSYAALLLSAEDLGQIFRRWQYLRQYDQFRKKQALAIRETQKMLSEKIQNLANKRLQKIGLIGGVEVQRKELNAEKAEKEKVVKLLKKDEQAILSQLKKQEQAREKLNDAIEAAIQSEMLARRERARRQAQAAAEKSQRVKPGSADKPAKNNVIEVPDSPADLALSASFSANKGRLPWPVSNGTILRGFGKQPHPTVPNITVDSRGIDIATTQGAEVRAVFGGEVVSIQYLPGSGYMVMLAHGSYYTVYTMERVSVVAGVKVAARQPIGEAGSTNLYQRAVVHFEVWKDKKIQNPTAWVNR